MTLGRIHDEDPSRLNEIEAATAESAEIIPLRQPLPYYSNSVRSIDAATFESGTGNFGTWQKEEWEMEDGTRYKVCLIEPAKRKTDVALVSGTPWGTQIEGLIMHGAISAARLGLPQIIISAEIGASVPISLSAHNQLQIVNHVEQSGFSEPKVSILKGFSREAMIIFGILAYAPQDERRILYADAIDPCMAVSLEEMVKQLGAHDILQAINYGAQEVVGALQLVARIMADPRRRKYYHKTIDASLEGARQFIRTGKPLFSGETGNLALHVPQDTAMNIGFMLLSMANNREQFEARLRQHPNITYTDISRVHSHGARRSAMNDTTRRLSGLVFQIARGIDYDEIDYGLVHQTK